MSSHTDYAAFRNINRYGANLAVTALRVFDEPFPKKVARSDLLIKLFVKRFQWAVAPTLRALRFA